MTEVWKKLPNNLNLSRYQVSSLGRIKNKHTGYVFKTKPRKTNGYICVCVKKDCNTSVSIKLHRLIALAFISNMNNKPIVDHINRIKHDNRIINLRWATYQENAINSTNVKCKTRIVVQMDIKGNFIKKWDGIRKAEDVLGISHGKISLVCRGTRNTTGGFKWKYNEPTLLKNEIWKKYNCIEVSNYGRIKKKTGYIYKGSKTTNGYMETPVNTKKKERVHRIVAKLFIPNLQNYPIINHKDGIKINNHVNNLEWTTYRENTIHAIKTGLTKTNKTKLGKMVIQYDKQHNKIAEYVSIRETQRQTGISRTLISNVCRGFSKQTKGFIFKFKYKNNINSCHYATKNNYIKATSLSDQTSYSFKSVADAAKFTNVGPSNIYSICKGRLLSSKGFTFEYE